MKKLDITSADQALIAAAIEVVKKPVLQISGEKSPALVGAALRLSDNSIVTSINLIADVGSLSVCAEPIAIAEAVKRPDHKIETIVAVYHAAGQEPRVVSPCGRCREAIADYATDGCVILREPGTQGHFKVRATDLLPLRYGEFWRKGELI
jgi:cytidine deaminase